MNDTAKEYLKQITTTCPICNSEKISKIKEYINRNEFREILICRNCKLYKHVGILEYDYGG